MFYRAVVCLLRRRLIRGIGRVYARGFWFSGLHRLLVLVFSGCLLLNSGKKQARGGLTVFFVVFFIII
jgi:hypothetical protein